MEKFEWVVRAIAQSPTVQIKLFPFFSNVADELAVEWEIGLEQVDVDLLEENQKISIKVLDDYMGSISGHDNLQYWDNDALNQSPEWKRMRFMAQDILKAMGWDNDPPLNSETLYVYVNGQTVNMENH